MEQVTLKNGSVSNMPVVKAVWTLVHEVLKHEPTFVIELVEQCRKQKGDPSKQNFVMSDAAYEYLKDKRVIDEVTGKVKEGIVQVVDAMSVGEGLELDFVNPVQGKD